MTFVVFRDLTISKIESDELLKKLIEEELIIYIIDIHCTNETCKIVVKNSKGVEICQGEISEHSLHEAIARLAKCTK